MLSRESDKSKSVILCNQSIPISALPKPTILLLLAVSTAFRSRSFIPIILPIRFIAGAIPRVRERRARIGTRELSLPRPGPRNTFAPRDQVPMLIINALRRLDFLFAIRLDALSCSDAFTAVRVRNSLDLWFFSRSRCSNPEIFLAILINPGTESDLHILILAKGSCKGIIQLVFEISPLFGMFLPSPRVIPHTPPIPIAKTKTKTNPSIVVPPVDIDSGGRCIHPGTLAKILPIVSVHGTSPSRPDVEVRVPEPLAA
ncbi:hypothetical protein RRF57_011710 [Xylaria bambusicola]|uniref:Uncharacterized protein n=1 Tax=Xylaria bambusicola TaxID=326684 RepID=A0AAN7UVC3_9PEZI